MASGRYIRLAARLFKEKGSDERYILAASQKHTDQSKTPLKIFSTRHKFHRLLCVSTKPINNQIMYITTLIAAPPIKVPIYYSKASKNIVKQIVNLLTRASLLPGRKQMVKNKQRCVTTAELTPFLSCPNLFFISVVASADWLHAEIIVINKNIKK